jgi:phage tail P2-like protein
VISVAATQSGDTVAITPSGPAGLKFYLTTLTLTGRDVRSDAKGDGPWTYVPSAAGMLAFAITDGIRDAFGQLWVTPPAEVLPSLLPANRTDQEAAIETTQAARIAAMDVPVERLWNPATCPAPLLPWLAWALSVDEWDNAWPEEAKRQVIADSATVHRVKGTIGAVRRALAAAGYGDATVHERWGATFYDGTWTYGDGTTYGSSANWATYAVELRRSLSVAEAALIRRILETVAPARCRLAVIGLPGTYGDGRAYNGTWKYGEVQWA